jgi:iron complex transport system ATP-binding protein
MDGEGSPALVLVTHHVEEILSGVSHVLLMKDGLHFRAGRKEEVLTSEALSAVYGAAVVVDEDGGRYRLRVVD